MACFVVPMAQAVATTIYRKHAVKAGMDSPITRSLGKLETMLYGGTAMLIVDHIISGEVVPYYPFFTALETEGGAWAMLREMLTVGVSMSVVVTLIWAVSVAVVARKQ